MTGNVIVVVVLAAAGILFAVGVLFAVVAGIFLWPKLRVLWKLIQAMPSLEPLMRDSATGLRFAGELAANTGRVSCAASQELKKAGDTLGSFQAPTVNFSWSSLGSELRNAGLLGGPAGPLDAISMVTGVTTGNVSIFGAVNPVLDASTLFSLSAGVLGYSCTATPIDFAAPLPDPPPFPSVARGLDDAATGLDLAADIVHAIQT